MHVYGQCYPVSVDVAYRFYDLRGKDFIEALDHDSNHESTVDHDTDATVDVTLDAEQTLQMSFENTCAGMRYEVCGIWYWV